MLAKKNFKSAKSMSLKNHIEKNKNIVSILYWLNFIIVISLNIIVYFYIDKLEHTSCECKIMWKHKYIKYATIMLIFLYIFKNFIVRYKKSINLYGNYIQYLENLYNTILIIFGGFFIQTLFFDDQNAKCTDCKYNKYRTLFIFTIFYIIIIACTVPAISYVISIFFKL